MEGNHVIDVDPERYQEDIGEDDAKANEDHRVVSVGTKKPTINGNVVQKLDSDTAAVHVNFPFRKLSASKKVIAAAAAGKKEAGSYKLAAAKKKVKKPKAKKPAAKKAAAKHKTKKPAEKAQKPTKKAAKKPADKKAVNNSVMIREHDFNKQCSMVAKPISQMMNVIKLSFPFNPGDDCCRALASPYWGNHKT